jgi:outer membrane immunogenic protein
MKKILFIFSLLLVTATVSQAQHTRVGALLGYGTQIENLGIGVIGDFSIGDTKFSLSPSFVYYLTAKNSFVKTSVWELNANVNYELYTNDMVFVYGLAGLNYTQVKAKADLPGFGSMSSSDGNIGLNIGGGVNFAVSEMLVPFAELKYAISEFDQLLIAAGVKFNF